MQASVKQSKWSIASIIYVYTVCSTTLETLKQKKEQLEKAAPEKTRQKKNTSTLPTNALFKLSQTVGELLSSWNLPNSDGIHFDNETGDFVINGKHRTSNGKGHRAITHAASTLGLMKYAEDYDQYHIGFSILDSPLLAYEEPDDDADDLSGTDVNIEFFKFLKSWGSRQVIVFENRKSIPTYFTNGEQITHFSKQERGRYGFFPGGSS